MEQKKHRTMEFNISALEKIKARIEQMSKTQHIEILQLLRNHTDVKLNENKSGIYVNLSFLPADAVNKLTQYIEYVDYQENYLDTDEHRKTEFKKTFFIEG